MSIELAPRHKEGLPLRSPLLLANGTPEILQLCDRSILGAVVAPAIGGRERRPRRVGERPGGLVIEEGRGAFSLTGLRRLVRLAGDLPVLGRVPAADPRSAGRTAGRLEGEGVRGLQVDLLPGDPGLAREALAAVRAACTLPLLAQVPLLEALPYALACAEGEADALLVAGPPPGLAVFDDPRVPRRVEVHGPLLHPLILLALQQVAEAVTLPLVARGGLLTLADAQAFLAQGATAVAADSLALIEPAAVSAIGRALTRP